MRAQAPPLGARAGARGRLGAGVFPPLFAVSGSGLLASLWVADKQPVTALLPTCSTLIESFPYPSHIILTVSQLKKRGVSSHSFSHNPQLVDPVVSTSANIHRIQLLLVLLPPDWSEPHHHLFRNSLLGSLLFTPSSLLCYQQSDQLSPVRM